MKLLNFVFLILIAFSDVHATYKKLPGTQKLRGVEDLESEAGEARKSKETDFIANHLKTEKEL